MPTPQPSDQDRADRLKLIEAAVSLGLSAWMVWQVMVPKHAKQLLAMRLLASAQKTAEALARLTGAASMAAELWAGREADGTYLVSLGLSLARDRFGQMYERARGITP